MFIGKRDRILMRPWVKSLEDDSLLTNVTLKRGYSFRCRKGARKIGFISVAGAEFETRPENILKSSKGGS